MHWKSITEFSGVGCCIIPSLSHRSISRIDINDILDTSKQESFIIPLIRYFFSQEFFFLLCRVNFFFNWTRPLTANGAVSFSCRARPFDEKLMSSQSIEQQGTLFLRAKSMEETRFSGHVHNDPLLGWGRDPPPLPPVYFCDE